MTVVLDTNMLLRYATPTDPDHPVVVAAIARFRAAGREVAILPQTVYEFWVVGTRPKANNGLGLTTAECDAELVRIEATFPLLPDLPTLYAEWRSLVVAHDCKGMVAHDARIAAALRCRGLSDLLTFNAADFRRFPGIAPLAP